MQLSVLSVLLPAMAFAGVERVANFALLDHHGASHQLRKYGDSKAVVLISLASRCEANINSLHKYRLLRTTWENQGISFIAIDASSEDELADLRLMDQRYHLDMPILNDSSQLVAENLGISKAGEILVLEPQRMRVLYRGGLDIEPVSYTHLTLPTKRIV